MPSPHASPGLRARKNRRTQHAIVQATVELTLEGGYAAATIPRIAERADVAPRTVSTWFPAKDDILFGGTDETIARAVRHLRAGPGGVVDRIDAWLAEESALEQPDTEISRLRDAAIAHDPELRARAHQHFDRIQSEIAAAVARDTGTTEADVGPQAFAGATVAFLLALRGVSLDGRSDAHAQLQVGIDFLRAGLAALLPR